MVIWARVCKGLNTQANHVQGFTTLCAGWEMGAQSSALSHLGMRAAQG